MKTRFAALCMAALFLPPLCTQALAFTPQEPTAEPRGRPGMMGRSQGMGDWGGRGGMGGWGAGMMGVDYGAINLSRDQRDKIHAIHRGLREKQFALMDRMHDNMHSVTFYRDGKFDEQAVRNAYATAEKMHRQMFENMLDAQKQVDALLTPQQRQQLGQSRQ